MKKYFFRRSIISEIFMMLVLVLFSIATVSVSAEDNHDPIAGYDFYGMDADSSLSISCPGVLVNDNDLDGDSLTAALVSDVCNGSLTLNADGSFVYTPDPGFVGIDMFFYQAYDGISYSNYSAAVIIVNATQNCVDDFPMYETHCGSDWTNHDSPYYYWFGRSGEHWEYPDSRHKHYVLSHHYTGYLDGNEVFSRTEGDGSNMAYHPTLSDGIHDFYVKEEIFCSESWVYQCIPPPIDICFWIPYPPGNHWVTIDYSNTITVYIDTTNPIGSIIINNGDVSTNSKDVTLSLTYSDSMSGVSQVRYSNDGVFDTEPWESPSPNKLWTLSSGCGTKIVWYQIKDNAGNTIIYQDDIELNEPPVADINGPYIIDEGSSITLIGTGSYDNDGYIVSYEWDLDNDGQYDDATGSTTIFSKPDNGAYQVGLKVTDNDGATDTDSTTVTVSNVAPTADLSNDGPLDEGGTATISFTDQYDPGTLDTFTYSFDWDNDGTYEIIDQTDSSATHSWCDNGDYPVKGKIKDNDGGSTEYTTTVTVNNVAPTADAGADKTGDETSTITFTGSHTDPGCDSWTYEWDFDYDGLTFDVDATGNDASNTWYDDFDGTVALRVTDNDGGIGIDTCHATVNNVAPTITSLTVTSGLVAVGDSVTLDATFTDPGTLDAHTACIDWNNDGTYEETIYPETTTITTTHFYSDAGVYTIKLKVKDDDDGSDTEIFQYVVVYDTSAGFVTGGGWIYSEPGAYPSDPDAEGKATFGFISKYQKGKQKPTGNTEFQFQVADLNFHSDNYDWLIITNHKAMYKGNGTINGDGNYGFMISAIDEKLTPSTDVDLFRIKIWDKDDGDTIIYDNQLGDPEDDDPTTAIGGGQIVIHKK